jgi:cellulose synthase/poly-beta-1,6-N-acetylglucosamine synthase-like glycosyltransferase
MEPRIGLAASWRDSTLARARRSRRELRAPGKTGAIERGLAELGDEVDVVVLTDADVVIAPEALTSSARAFEREPRLAWRRITALRETLCDDGALCERPRSSSRPREHLYDWATARVARGRVAFADSCSASTAS